MEVKDVTDTSALVSWSQPVAPADRVTMIYGLSSDPSDGTNVDIFPPDKQSSIDGLRPDTEYKVSLISRRGEKESSEPVTTTFTTGAFILAATADPFFNSAHMYIIHKTNEACCVQASVY